MPGFRGSGSPFRGSEERRKTRRSIAEVLETLETQAAFHGERESFHGGQEEQHREQRSAHGAKLQEIRRHLEAFRAAAVEALDRHFADRLRRPVEPGQVSVAGPVTESLWQPDRAVASSPAKRGRMEEGAFRRRRPPPQPSPATREREPGLSR